MPQRPPQLEHSHEVQEILGHVPHWLIRWGIALLFFIFTLIISGSYFFKYPVNVSADVVITTVNSPAPLTAGKNGRIARWLAKDGQLVNVDEVIAQIDSEVDLESLRILETLVHKQNLNPLPDQLPSLLKHSQLAEFQPLLQGWFSSSTQLAKLLKSPTFERKRQLLEKRIENQSAYYEQMLVHRDLKQKEFNLASEEFKRDSILYRLNKYAISKAEFETSHKKYLARQADHLVYNASFYDHELNILKSKQELIELTTGRMEETAILTAQIRQSISGLKLRIDEWKKLHLIKTPVAGKLTLTKYWSENQIITAGTILATVIPRERVEIICRAFVSSSGIGKVKTGQKVNIKLSGFPYMEYGILQGSVNSVSLVPEEQGYVIGIKLIHGMTSTYKERLKFIQEMDGMAEIVTEEKRLLYKFFSF